MVSTPKPSDSPTFLLIGKERFCDEVQIDQSVEEPMGETDLIYKEVLSEQYLGQYFL
jgi:hypothetical protein